MLNVHAHIRVVQAVAKLQTRNSRSPKVAHWPAATCKPTRGAVEIGNVCGESVGKEDRGSFGVAVSFVAATSIPDEMLRVKRWYISWDRAARRSPK